MNDNTLMQWDAYCIKHDLGPVARMVLKGLVKHHSAAEGFTRPGERLLVKESGAANNTVARVLKRLVEDRHIKLIKQFPKPARMADAYAIPWLHNAPANAGTGAPANAGTGAPANAGTKRSPRLQIAVANAGTSLPLTGKQGGADAPTPPDDDENGDPHTCPECLKPNLPGQWRHAHCKPKPPPPIAKPRDWTQARHDDPPTSIRRLDEQREADIALAMQYAT
jgi:hypothetical protein